MKIVTNSSQSKMIKEGWEGESALAKYWSQNLAKGQKNVTKTHEIIGKGIANSNGLKRGSQIFNYDIYINIFFTILFNYLWYLADKVAIGLTRSWLIGLDHDTLDRL